MNMYNLDKNLIQNLNDAGCDNKQIEELMKLYKQGKKEEIHKILDKHRKNILNKVHKSEKEISCIDYFIYQMDKK